MVVDGTGHMSARLHAALQTLLYYRSMLLVQVPGFKLLLRLCVVKAQVLSRNPRLQRN